jgi:hypothetical protein
LFEQASFIKASGPEQTRLWRISADEMFDRGEYKRAEVSTAKHM